MTSPDVFQRRAVVGFLPFCLSALRGKLPRPGPGRLPLRQPEALTAEVVAAIQDIASKATYRWLFADLGWRTRAGVDPDDPEEVREGRLWDPAVWGEARLEFTAESIDALILAWNLLAPLEEAEILLHAQRPKGRRWTKMDAEERRRWLVTAQVRVAGQLRRQDGDQLASLGLHAGGDLLFTHLLARPFLEVASPADAASWTHNPLSQMAAMEVAQHEDTSRLGRLLAPDVLPMMPWIASEWPALWRLRRARGWGGGGSLERLRRAWAAQAGLWSAWIQQADQAERLDLLAPLLEGYRDQLRSLEADRAALERMVGGMRLAERQEARDAWAEAWRPLLVLLRILQRTRALHPVDRLAHHRLLLASASGYDLAGMAARGEATLRDLRAEIG